MSIEPAASSPSPIEPTRSQPPRTPERPQAVERGEDAAERHDAIELSEQAQEVLRLDGDAAERARLIRRLREQVDAGTYRPDADAVARRLAEQGGP